MATKDGPTETYFRAEDIVVFRRAAKLFGVYIAVRRTNPRSLPYIGKPGYAPKLIDCKAKTAEENVNINGRAYTTAGLVVDCDVLRDYLPIVFGRDKVESAIKEWRAFAHGSGENGASHYRPPKLAPKSLYDGRGRPLRTICPEYTYFTQMDPGHVHYGCVRHSPTTLATGGSYVHADYDLYAVVPAGRTENVFVRERRLGEPHSRSPQQMDVQNYVTSHIPGMVCHGEQDTFKTDLDDALDVFYPDGATIRPAVGRHAIETLYATVFEGRRMVAGGADPGAAAGAARPGWQRA
ncbi:hypothetical protein OPKNFCMD_1940 [Methylobacterium crusticola]|uniref:Uncharacterized protein n=1 Tax=Methylobacterium crusticola TaxID=1697972 RepID=A0ABQ4QWU6_9HYPH|nr:hypothetical protein [Methylobacterium crusticola]GJD49210.1 hypothetical protein OPKNFCMD_1940 [Methylobacterium crusticola]